MERIEFSIQGSAPDPYRIVFTRVETKVIGLCSCPAGDNGQWCKHRLGILRSEKSVCSALSESDLAIVHSWLPGTALETAAAEVTAAEDAVAKAQKAAKAAKKKLADALLGRA